MEGGLTLSLPRISEVLPALTQPLVSASQGLLCTLGCCTLASSYFQMLGRLGPIWVLPHVSMSYLRHQTMNLNDANIFYHEPCFCLCPFLHHTQFPTRHHWGEGNGSLRSQGSIMSEVFPTILLPKAASSRIKGLPGKLFALLQERCS